MIIKDVRTTLLRIPYVEQLAVQEIGRAHV